MKVRVIYFGLLAERRGVAEEWVETSAASPAELYAELDVRHALGLAIRDFRAAIHDEFVSWDHPLADQDVVALLPPMSGG